MWSVSRKNGQNCYQVDFEMVNFTIKLEKKESLIEIVEFMVKILTMKLPVSRNETGKKVNFAWL